MVSQTSRNLLDNFEAEARRDVESEIYDEVPNTDFLAAKRALEKRIERLEMSASWANYD